MHKIKIVYSIVLLTVYTILLLLMPPWCKDPPKYRYLNANNKDNKD